MGNDINLLKGVSKPLTKLVEVVAAGCGRVYEPTHLLRMAKAQAEADRHAAIEQRLTEHQLEVLENVLSQEARRQENIAAIAYQATKELPPAVDPAPVDPDWAMRFFAECGDISNEQMQILWARLLAGEVAKPGSFSVRTLSVVKNLSSREAAVFHTISTLCCALSGRRYPAIFDMGSPYLEKIGVTAIAIMELEAAGLLSYQTFGSLELRDASPGRLPFGTYALHLAREEKANLRMGQVTLTQAGQELSSLAESDPPIEHLLNVAMHIRSNNSGWTVTHEKRSLTGEWVSYDPE